MHVDRMVPAGTALAAEGHTGAAAAVVHLAGKLEEHNLDDSSEQTMEQDGVVAGAELDDAAAGAEAHFRATVAVEDSHWQELVVQRTDHLVAHSHQLVQVVHCNLLHVEGIESFEIHHGRLGRPG